MSDVNRVAGRERLVILDKLGELVEEQEYTRGENGRWRLTAIWIGTDGPDPSGERSEL